MSPLVSIIIPVFNRADLLTETLSSIQTQSFENFECILVDDGSTDGSQEVLKQFAKLDQRFVFFDRPSGLKKGGNTCRNYGFSKCRGKYVSWFDSDDIMVSDSILTRVNAIESNDAEVVVCRLGFFKENPLEFTLDTRLSIEPKTDNPPLEFFAGGFWFGTIQPMFLKEVIEKQASLFDTDLFRNQETEFFVRILLGNPKIIYLNEPLVLLRGHSNSISGNYNSQSENQKLLINWPAYKKIYLSFKDTPYLTAQAIDYFKDFFFRCLRKMNFSKNEITDLYFFGVRHKLFPSNLLATRLFVSRLIRRV
jgi:glycosyltransferase involved in cell wall biosynthesis